VAAVPGGARLTSRAGGDGRRRRAKSASEPNRGKKVLADEANLVVSFVLQAFVRDEDSIRGVARAGEAREGAVLPHQTGGSVFSLAIISFLLGGQVIKGH